MLRALLWVVVLPESVPRCRRGYQGGRERQRCHPWYPADREQRTAGDLDGAADSHSLLGVIWHKVDVFRESAHDRVGLLDHALRRAHGLVARNDVDRGNHRARKAPEYGHAPPTAPPTRQENEWASKSVAATVGTFAEVAMEQVSKKLMSWASVLDAV